MTLHVAATGKVAAAISVRVAAEALSRIFGAGEAEAVSLASGDATLVGHGLSAAGQPDLVRQDAASGALPASKISCCCWIAIAQAAFGREGGYSLNATDVGPARNGRGPRRPRSTGADKKRQPIAGATGLGGVTRAGHVAVRIWFLIGRQIVTADYK